MKSNKLYIFGDSIVSCGQLKVEEKWSVILKVKLKNKTNLIVRSVNGITTSDALKNINFKTTGINITLLMFGINDSIYYKSMNGKPRVNLEIFKKNYIQIIKKVKKNAQSKIFIINGHKFLRKRLEGNRKTHNYNYLKYFKVITELSKEMSCDIIDTYSKLCKYKTFMYNLSLPDGLHLNKFGSKKYSEIIFNKIKHYYL